MKNKYLERVDTSNLNNDTKKLLKEQIELFYTYETTTYPTQKNEVILSTNNLIHGSRANLETLEIISKTGLIASEFYGELNSNKKKPYVIELWDIKENNFRDYIIYQNQEQRFIPNDIVENDTSVAFIIEYNENEQNDSKNKKDDSRE